MSFPLHSGTSLMNLMNKTIPIPKLPNDKISKSGSSGKILQKEYLVNIDTNKIYRNNSFTSKSLLKNKIEPINNKKRHSDFESDSDVICILKNDNSIEFSDDEEFSNLFQDESDYEIMFSKKIKNNTHDLGSFYLIGEYFSTQ